MDHETEENVHKCCRSKHKEHPEDCDNEVEGEHIIRCREKILSIPEEKITESSVIKDKFLKSWKALKKLCNENTTIPKAEQEKMAECVPFWNFVDESERPALKECDKKVVIGFREEALKEENVTKAEKDHIRAIPDTEWRISVFCEDLTPYLHYHSEVCVNTIYLWYMISNNSLPGRHEVSVQP